MTTINQWNPSQEYSELEQLLMKRQKRHKKLFAFLREYRSEIFDDDFQDELASMYRDTGAGKEPVTPALMAMAMLLQAYTGASDATVVEMTVVDKRWQMVLDRVGETTPAFSQGALWDFRERFIKNDMDRRLLEKTREIARRTKGFDWKKIPKDLSVAMDSSPLEGVGRVEDTLNLLAHAARNVVSCAASILNKSFEQVATEAGIPLLLASSVKAGLDMNWNNPGARNDALNRLMSQLESLEEWLAEQLQDSLERPPLESHLQTLNRICDQDLEPDPSDPNRMQIRQGTAKERQISIEDDEMRHGRKSKSQRVDGYKRHLSVDLATGLILAAAITPANRPESEAAEDMNADIEQQELSIENLYIDRGYLASPIVEQVTGKLICRPWPIHNSNGLFSKELFTINMRSKLITCPDGQTKPIEFGKTVKFDADVCDSCCLREQCTNAKPGTGRSVHIAEDERLQKRLRKQAATAAGRKELRKRVTVEHKLAHISQRQGNQARYKGKRKNLFDLRRAAAIQNLETIQRTNSQNRKAA